MKRPSPESPVDAAHFRLHAADRALGFTGPTQYNSGLTLAEKARLVFELMEGGYAMQRQNLRRRNPDWTEDQVAAAFHAWLVERPLDYSEPEGSDVGQ